MCLLEMQSIRNLAHCGLDVVLAGDSGLQHDDCSAREVDDQGQLTAEHVSLTVKMPADADAQYIELQDVSIAVTLHVSLFSAYVSY